MFFDNSNGKFVPPNGLSARALQASSAAQDAAIAARNRLTPAAQSAATAAQLKAQAAAAAAQVKAQAAAAAAQQAAQSAAMSARGWAAPRLETAADYWSNSAAPRVHGALRSTAQRVSPEDSKGTGRSMLQVILLSIAALAGAGAVAAVIQRQRGKLAARKDSESDVMDVGDSNEPTASVPGQAASSSETADAGMNGQASPSRW